ncbi:MAG: galactokinase [Marmoricola sp.]|nr:galactokinase [Marmoricola sp.]
MLPTAVSARAPGRVNLIGEHLDYNGGRSLPIAIDLATTATVTRSADGRTRCRSSAETPGWTAYVTGVLAALEVTEPLHVTITSDLPIGAGLSSSAALECSVALAVNDLLGLGRSRSELVQACVRAETEYVGVPTGGMDQTTSLYADAGAALLLDFADDSRTPVPFDPSDAGLTLLVIDTRVSHALVDGAYAARRADCESAAKHLGIQHLASATADQIEGLPGGRIGRRARHVFTEQARVRAYVDAVAADHWQTAGTLMTASHESLRDDYEVSCPELDLAAGTATALGALGARMTGGGFGGSAIALAPSDLLERIRNGVAAAFADNGHDAPTFYEVEASRGAEVLSAT